MLDSPGMITEGDQNGIDVFRKTFPYFVPVRYLDAVERNKMSAFSPAMLTSLQPYMGNWMLFCDFLESGNKVPVQTVKEEAANASSTTDFFALIREEMPEPVEQAIVENIPEPEPVFEWTAPPVEEPIEVPEPVAEAQYEQPVPQITNDTEAKDEITEVPVSAPPAQQAEPEPEPVVAVSEAFLQMIREEGLESTKKNEEEKTVEAIYVPPIAIVPQPVFEPNHEAPTTQAPEPPVISNNGHAARPYTPPTDQPAIIVRKEIVEIVDAEEVNNDTEEESPLIFPIYTQDYFLQQGEKVPDELPAEIDDLIDDIEIDDEDKSLMVMMSFTEWLVHFKSTSRKQEEEKKDQKALKTMWQKEKLAAAIEEENEEIPENVFEMAVNSIAKEDGLASESLADIYIKQGKYDKAIDMFKKLSLRNPQKNAYFARKIEEVLKDKQS